MERRYVRARRRDQGRQERIHRAVRRTNGRKGPCARRHGRRAGLLQARDTRSQFGGSEVCSGDAGFGRDNRFDVPPSADRRCPHRCDDRRHLRREESEGPRRRGDVLPRPRRRADALSDKMPHRHARRDLRVPSRRGAADNVPLSQIGERGGVQGRTRGAPLHPGPVPRPQGRCCIGGDPRRGLRAHGDPRRHPHHTGHGRLYRPFDPARLELVRPVHPGEHQDPGARPRVRSLPCLCGQKRGSGEGMRYRRRFQDAVSRRMQFDGEPPGPFRRGRRLPSDGLRPSRDEGGGAPRRRPHPCHHIRGTRLRRGLGHGVRRPDPLDPCGRFVGGGRLLHQCARVTSYRRHRRPRYGGGRLVRRRSRFGRRLRQRIHQIRRRIPLRQGGGGGDQHQQDPCPRTGGDGGPDDLQVRPGRERPGGEGLRRAGCEEVQASPVGCPVPLRRRAIRIARICWAMPRASW